MLHECYTFVTFVNLLVVIVCYFCDVFNVSKVPSHKMGDGVLINVKLRSVLRLLQESLN